MSNATLLPSLAKPTNVHNSGDTVRVRFDVISNGKAVQFADLRIAGDSTILARSFHQMYVDLPVDKIPSTGVVNLEVDVHFGERECVSAVAGSIEISRNNPHEQLSEDPIENSILNALMSKDVFPLRSPDVSTWTWNIASPYHDGKAVHSVDLTLPGSTDHGKEVYVPLEGKVIRDGTDSTHTVILEHQTMDAQGNPVVWYTKYMHMENIGLRDAQGNVTSLTVGDILAANTVLGAVSDYGSPGQYHLHLEVMKTLGDGFHGETIDLRTLLTNGLGITSITAEDAGADGSQANWVDNMSFQVEWNRDVNGFVTTAGQDGSASNNPMLVLDRSAQFSNQDVPTAEANQYWLAWEEGKSVDQMERVVWDANTSAWYQWNVSKNTFFENDDGIKRQWLPESQTWSYDI